MVKYGDDNKDYSDSQRDFYNGDLYGEDDIVYISNRHPAPNTKVSKGAQFCPNCGSMMSPGSNVCRCGYPNQPKKNNNSSKHNLIKCPNCGKTIKKNAVRCKYCNYYFKQGRVLPKTNGVNSKNNNSSKHNLIKCPNCGKTIKKNAVRCKYCNYYFKQGRVLPKTNGVNSKRKTYIELNVKNYNLKFNHQIEISGHLRLKNNYVLINANIEIYFAGRYLKSALTDGEGHFESKFLADTNGKQEIKVIFKGDSEYETSAARTYVNIIGQIVNNTNTSNSNDDIITKLERLGALYERGLLTEEEFRKMKRRLIG